MRHTICLWMAFILIPLLLMMVFALPAQIRFVFNGRDRIWKGQLRLGIFNGKLGFKIGFPHPRKIPKRRTVLARNGAGGRYKFQSGINRASVNFFVQWRRWRDVITGIKRSIGVFKILLHRSVCSRLLWETGFGLDDYAATGMTAGLLWAGKGLLISLLSRHLRIRPAGVRIAVVPQFGGACYASNLDCILETSLGHIILVAFKLGAIWLIRNPGLLARGKRYA